MFTSIVCALFFMTGLPGPVVGQYDGNLTYTNPVRDQPGADPSVNFACSSSNS
jgi:hypothetical protein